MALLGKDMCVYSTLSRETCVCMLGGWGPGQVCLEWFLARNFSKVVAFVPRSYVQAPASHKVFVVFFF